MTAPWQPSEVSARERDGITDALLESADYAPQTAAQLFAAVRDEWGECSDAVLGRQLSQLVRRGELLHVGDGYVLAGGDR